MKEKILVILGLTCSGKDTVQNYLLEKKNFNSITSTTTRPMRPGETEGIEYFFKNNEEFENMIKNEDLIEYREYNTLLNNVPALWYYGVEKDKVKLNKKPTVVILDPIGLEGFVEHFGKENIVSLWIDATEATRKIRNIERGDFDETEFNRRNKKDTVTFKPVRDVADYIVVNNDEDEYLYLQINKLLEKEFGYVTL